MGCCLLKINLSLKNTCFICTLGTFSGTNNGTSCTAIAAPKVYGTHEMGFYKNLHDSCASNSSCNTLGSMTYQNAITATPGVRGVGFSIQTHSMQKKAIMLSA